MVAAVTAAWALFFGIGLIMLGNGLQSSLLGLRAAVEGFPTTVTGLVMSGYFVGFLAGSALTPKLVARVGHIRVFAAFASLASTAALVHAVLVDPVSWAAMRVLTGFCYAGLYVVSESWLNDRATNETRGRLLAIYMLVASIGMAGGQGLLNLADPADFELFVLASILVSLALIPILLTASPAPSFDAPHRIGLAELYRTSPLGVVGTAATGLAHGSLIGMGAVYAQAAGLSVAEVSLFMAAVFLGGMVLQWPLGRLSDSFDRRRVLTLVTTGAALLAVAAAAVGPQPLWALLGLTALFGGLCIPLYSICVAHTNDHLSPRQMVAASGSLYLVVGAGAALGPFAVSTVMSATGSAGFFLFLAAVHVGVAGFALYRMTRRPSLPLAEQDAVAAMPPQASPVVAALTPETAREPMDDERADLARADT